ncbi:MAG: cell division protein FtsE [Candidatus Entotheonella factor]|uniref:Cell division ATP-binding protein FtsE n=1 Tax=Entotheonella factor TaxID=1429438 RepID=W4LV13_ENTF1|nr:cell division ATP-binding protein FtsE [Candidatus Entotheonella palauensis]ETX01740.1 MAG: cell division protein FtsE [Candidatus Entotheonella factor]
MIRVFDVDKTYDHHITVLTALTFHIAKGEMAFLTGPSGAGKTTLLRLLYGAERPDRGQIIVNGRNIARLQHRHLPLLRRSLGLVFQDFRLLLERTAFDNIAFALRAVGTPAREVRERVTELLEQVGLAHRRDTLARRLSGGEQQRAAIARALINAPELVLADEPTGNLDPDMTQEIMRLFQEIHQRGTTVLIATHDRDLIQNAVHRANCRVLTLRDGRIVEP